jgi:putative ABC transport system permease protein
MTTFLRDLRYAFRTFVRSPGLTIVILVTLALGIGVNTAIFSVIDAVVLRPLPFDEADRLVMIWETNPPRGLMSNVTSYATVGDWRAQGNSFDRIATFVPQSHTVGSIDRPEQIDGARVSADFFPMLRVQPVLGRLFDADDDQPGAENVVILSHGIWQRQFGADPEALGRTMSLDAIDFTIIGVLPRGLAFPVRISGAEVWTPCALDEEFIAKRELRLLCAAGRLKPGVTLEQAQANLETITRSLEAQYPQLYDQAGVRLVPLLDEVVGDVRPALLLILGAVGLVLLIACANVANLLLAHGAGRRAEFAIRTAMGAGRWRLVRQLLTESLLLSIVGGGVGVVLSVWGLEALVAAIPDDLPRMDTISVDSRVLGFAFAVTLVTSLVFGLAPALTTSRVNLHESLKEGGRTPTAAGRQRLGGSLVVAEVALALMLLVGAGLLTRSFQRLVSVDPGFNTTNLLTFYMDAGFSKQLDLRQRAAMYTQIRDRIQVLPGVERVIGGTSLPLRRSRISFGVYVEGRPPRPSGEIESARFCSISSDYFRALGVPLLRGRMFTEEDRFESPGVMIINETMAKRIFPDEDPVGKRIRSVMRLEEGVADACEIVGIVADAREAVVDGAQPYMYVPMLQQTWPFMNYAVRTTVDPQTLVGAIREAAAEIAKDEAVFAFQTMDERFDEAVARDRFTMLLLAVFAAVALILAAIGIYGMLSYSVVRRTHEIGVRMALGAQRENVLRLVLKQGLTVTTLGLVLGLVVSLSGSRILSSMLYEIGAADPGTFLAVSVLLAAVALLACYLPARRATKVDPMVALRCE